MCATRTGMSSEICGAFEAGGSPAPGARNLFRFNARRSEIARLLETMEDARVDADSSPRPGGAFMPLQREAVRKHETSWFQWRVAVPEGLPENSPAFQRREGVPEVSSPEGTAEINPFNPLFLPSSPPCNLERVGERWPPGRLNRVWAAISRNKHGLI